VADTGDFGYTASTILFGGLELSRFAPSAVLILLIVAFISMFRQKAVSSAALAAPEQSAPQVTAYPLISLGKYVKLDR
jgi:hypothetical protein